MIARNFFRTKGHDKQYGTLGGRRAALPVQQNSERQLIRPLAIVQQNQHGMTCRPERIQKRRQRLFAPLFRERLGAEANCTGTQQLDQLRQRGARRILVVSQSGSNLFLDARFQACRCEDSFRHSRE